MAEVGCGGKHLRLALAILGLVVAIVAGGALYAAGTASGKADAAEVRRLSDSVQTLDTQGARVDERLKRIEDDVKWVRTRLEGGRP